MPTEKRARAARMGWAWLLLAAAAAAQEGAPPDSPLPPAAPAATASSLKDGTWQNPRIGVVADMTLDAHDAEGAFTEWRSGGLTLRAVELDVSHNIDPFASLHVNAALFSEGVELHEAYALARALPGNLKLKAGRMLAAFGHFGRFHSHFLPFTSEPRIYREYLGGSPLLNGLELSWLLPLDRYIEVTVSAYDRLVGDSHDTEPGDALIATEADRIAEQFGYRKHGTHYDKPGGGVATVAQVEALAPERPMSPEGSLTPSDFVFGGRAATTMELGEDWSVDIGSGGLYQGGHRHSRRLEGVRYAKGVAGLDVNVYWHPLRENMRRSLDFGVEGILNSQGFERIGGSRVIEDRWTRGGAFAHLRYRHSPRWQYGAFGEAFQPIRDDASEERRRYGVFVTLHPSHFQFLRIEASRYHVTPDADPVNRIVIQYDAVIGYHSHGRLR